MMSRRVLAGIVACTMTATATAQDYPTPKPTKEHAILKKDVGTWDAEMSMWVAPDTPAMKSKAVEKNRMLGDFWVISEFEGEFGGQKFSGHGTFGYDPTKKKFIGMWVDSMNPSPSRMVGEYDDKTGTLTMMGTSTGPDGQTMHTKSEARYVDDNTRIFTMYNKMGDKFVKGMEIKYTRRK